MRVLGEFLPKPTFINELVEAKKSPTHGRGVFALVNIPKGTYLAPYDGIKMTTKAFKAKYGDDIRYTYSLGRHHARLVGKTKPYLTENVSHYVNEGKRPNVLLKSRGLYAKRALKQGEELFLEYHKNYPRDYIVGKGDMDDFEGLLADAELFHTMGGSAASGFIARMMAENRVKNKGAYGPKTDLPKGSKMSSPAKFNLKAIANSKQKKGATGTKEYGASPFLLKHFGVDESDNPMYSHYPRYKPKTYRTPVPDAPFKLKRGTTAMSESDEEEEPKPRGRPKSPDTYYNEAMAEYKKDRAEDPDKFGPGQNRNGRQKLGQLYYIREALNKWGEDFAKASSEERRRLVLDNPRLLNKFKIGEREKAPENRGQRDFYKDIDYDALLALLDGTRAVATREVAKMIKNATRKPYEDKE